MALRTLPQIVQAAEWPNVRAFTCILAYGEVGKTEGGWNIRYGGVHQPPKTFDSFADHPRIYELTEDGQKSSAAGRFQITASTWDDFIRAGGPMDFSPANQYLSAVWLMERAKALDDVIAGRIEQAMAKLGGVWVSLRTDRVKKAAAQVYRDNGGLPPESFEPQQTQPEVKPVAPIVIPLLEVLAPLIPALGKLFGSGSEVANRNVAAASLAADAIVKVTNSVNLQEAVEKVQSDPDALNAAKEVVSRLVMEIGEAGGGGIEGARKAAMASEGDWKRVVFTGPFMLAVAVLPLVYAVVIAALLKAPWIAEITSEVRTGVITSVTGLILGSLMGYFYGTSASSQRKTDAILK